VEWTGLLLLVCLAAGAAVSVMPVVDGRSFGGFLAHRIGCLARGGCHDGDAALARTYGERTAALVREQAPGLVYEPGERQLPVDYRRCRDPECAGAPDDGDLDAHRSNAGEPATVFTRVVRRGGRTYVQYWLYYPDSNTAWAGSDKVWERSYLLQVIGQVVRGTRDYPGFHEDDWEGYQVRIDPDGSVDARASSHNGYNGADAPAVDWASDASGKVPGASAVRDATERLGFRDEGGWTPSEGTLYVSGGSHAGHATESSLRRELAGLLANTRLAIEGRPPSGPLARRRERHRQELLANRLGSALFGPGARMTPRGSVVLIPIETLRGRDTHSFEISPPWRKRVYTDPEYGGTD
jgi:hypothetical protein